MEIKHQKFISLSLVLSIVLTASIWYFFPVLQYNWHVKRTLGDYINEQLSVTPICVSAVNVTSEEWNELNIGGFFFKVPKLEYKKVFSEGDRVYFFSEKGAFIVSYTGSKKESIDTIEGGGSISFSSFREKAAILKSVPSDISIFNARNKNKQAWTYQHFKFMSLNVGKLIGMYIIDSKSLKATCMIYKMERKRYYYASADIYSNDEAKLLFNVSLSRYNKLRELKEDLLKSLSSIKVPALPLNIEIVRKDINEMPQKYLGEK